MSTLDRLLGGLGLIRKSDAIIPEFHLDSESQPRTPEFNLFKLYDVVDKNWVIQQVYRAIIQETLRPGVHWAPKYAVRCDNCDNEYQETVDKCEICSSNNLVEPDPRQRRRGELLLDRPNSDRETFGKILSSITYHDLVADDWYIEIKYSLFEDRLVPSEIKVRDPKFVRPIVDEFGNIGQSNQWFCPICWNYKTNDDVKPTPVPCPKCGCERLDTAYIQQVDQDVTARWGIDQIVHGSTYRVLPGLFGNPRSRSLWSIIHVINAMDEWFVDTFSEGRPQKLVNFPGWDQNKLTELMRKVQNEVKRLQVLDDRSGRMRSKKNLRTIFLTSDQPISVHDIGINPDDIQLLDYYRLCIQAVAGIYGVQAVFISFVERGKTGTTPAMQIEVQNRTITEIQRDKEQILNGYLFPIFGITDWLLKFGELEKRDEATDAEIWERKARTVATLTDAGYDVTFNEFMEIEVSKERVRDPVSPQRFEGPPGTTTSDASGRQINETSTQRDPHGTRPSTATDEEREKA